MTTDEAIFAATERLLARRQLHEFSVSDIVAEADSSRATFYRHFASKDAVVAGLLAKVMDEVYNAIAAFVDATGDRPGPILRDALARGWEVFDAHRPVMRAVSEHWHRVPEIETMWLSIIDRFTAAIAGQIDQERAAGVAPPGIESTRLAAMLLWSTERLMYVAAREDDVQATLTPVTELWLRAIYGAP